MTLHLPLTIQERHAIHEASHTVVCQCVGCEIVQVTISDSGSYLRRAAYQPSPDIGLHAMCILALAGSVGEESCPIWEVQ